MQSSLNKLGQLLHFAGWLVSWLFSEIGNGGREGEGGFNKLLHFAGWLVIQGIGNGGEGGAFSVQFTQQHLSISIGVVLLDQQVIHFTIM